MPKKIEHHCGSLTLKEFKTVFNHAWDKKGVVAKIPYTFDVTLLPKYVLEDAKAELNQKSFDVVNAQTRYFLESILRKWELACDQAVKFEFISKPKPSGICML